MASVSAPPVEKTDASKIGLRTPSWKSLLLIGFCILLAVVLAMVAFALSPWWPYSQSAVIQDLEEASNSKVTVRTFRETFFPSPGCVMEGLVFQRGNKDSKPLIAIDRLTVRGSYPGILSHRVSRMTADGMRVSIPAFGQGAPFHTTKSKITIDEVVANGSTVEFAHEDSAKEAFRFEIHEATLKNVGWSHPLTYHLKVHNPKPPGEVTADGEFGVWRQRDAGETPISGEYKFERADLGAIGGVRGTLSSTGKFSGKLAHIDISGTTDIPDFEVKSGRHSVDLKTNYTAYVDATKGDTFLNRVDADFWHTYIVAEGSIAKSDGDGKVALIELRSGKARIEDILLLFVKARRAPMSGNVTLRAHAEIPGGKERFLKRVKLRGDFGITEGLFSEHTQKGVDKLSAGARGEKESNDKEKDDPETVLTDLKGHVNLAGGTATFSDLSFGVPGAVSRMHGTYNLITHKIDLRGQLKVDSKISNTTSGAKAIFLKMIEPFFKKRRRGEIVPVRISGTYEHPTFGLDLNDKKAQKVADP
jgi:hypothetical protein